MSEQLRSLKDRKETLQGALDKADQPLESLKEQQKCSVAKRIEAEERLASKRSHMESLSVRLQADEKKRHVCEDAVSKAREAVESGRLNKQSIKVRVESLEEQMKEDDVSVDAVLTRCETIRDVAALDEAIAHKSRRIDRLGPINLVAITELEERAERKKLFRCAE